MYHQLFLYVLVFLTILKYFGSPRGVVQKENVAIETNMEHQEIVTSILTELKEKKKVLPKDEYRAAASQAFKIVTAQYKLILEFLEREEKVVE